MSIKILSLDSGEHREILRRGFFAKAKYMKGRLLIVEGGSLLAVPMDPDRPDAKGQPVTVLEGIQRPFETVAVSDAGTLAYLPAVPSTARIVQVDRQDGTEISWTIPGLSTMNPIRLSPDGERLAVNLEGATGLKRDIGVYDLARGTLTQLSRTGQNRVPVWSPDGLHVAFQSNRDGVDGIFVMPADGTGDARPVLLREAGRSRVSPRAWTPDGERIVYREPTEGGADFWMVSREGGKPTPLLRSPFDEGRLGFSRNGRFITFHSNESGQYQIYVQELPDGRKWPVTNDGGMWPAWIGKEIFYRRGDTVRVVVVETDPFRASVPKALFERPNVLSYDVSATANVFF